MSEKTITNHCKRFLSSEKYFNVICATRYCKYIITTFDYNMLTTVILLYCKSFTLVNFLRYMMCRQLNKNVNILFFVLYKTEIFEMFSLLIAN